MMQARSTETMLKGCITEHCVLGYSAKKMALLSGSWQVTITVYEIERLLELAHKGLEKSK